MRKATLAAHDRLDSAMRKTGWQDCDSYALFLQVQYAARRPVEDWVAQHCPPDLAPPAQCELIARDLAALGAPCRAGKASFALPNSADPIGLAWALAGSSLGNRAILHDIDKAGNGDWPTEFLADPAMTAYWRVLRARIEAACSVEEGAAAIGAATAMFEHFAETAAAMTRRLAA